MAYSQRDKDGNYIRFHGNGRISQSLRIGKGTYYTHDLARSNQEELRRSQHELDVPGLNENARAALKFGLLSIFLFWTVIVPAIGLIQGVISLFTYNRKTETAGSMPAAIIGMLLSIGFLIAGIAVAINIVHALTPAPVHYYGK